MSSFIYADSSWVSLGGNMFEHPNDKGLSKICIEDATYDFNETEKNPNKFQLKYSVVGLEHRINEYGSYPQLVGHLGACVEHAYKVKTEAIMINDPRNTLIKEKTEEFKTYTSNSDDPTSQAIRHGNLATSTQLEITTTLLSNHQSLIEQCLHIKTPSNTIAMYYNRYLLSGNNEIQLSGNTELVIQYPCDCDLDAILGCPKINSIADKNGDGILEIIERINGPDGNCVRVYELINTKFEEVYYGSFYDGEC